MDMLVVIDLALEKLYLGLILGCVAGFVIAGFWKKGSHLPFEIHADVFELDDREIQ